MSYTLSPIVLFTYNRPWHTQQALDALALNEEAKDSILYVFCDGAKKDENEGNLSKINAVRKIVTAENRFKEVIIKVQNENKGLANSIINGVTEIVNIHKKVIVLEDDILTSSHFINYMNTSLDLYKHKANVKQISAFAFDLGIKNENKAYFMPFTSTWGWAIWKRSWDEIDFNPQDYLRLKSNSRLRKQFDLGESYDYTSMLITQMESDKINSWGIRFWWSIFKSKGLVLHPDYSLVQNIGFDNSGVHCDTSDFAATKNWNRKYRIVNYPTQISIDSKNFKQLKFYLKISLNKNKVSLIEKYKKKIYIILKKVLKKIK